MLFDLGHGKTDGAQLPQNVQSPYIADAVHAVAVAVAAGLQDADLLVVAQRIGADAV